MIVTPDSSAGRNPTQIRMAFVHTPGMCWTFFQYHLSIKAKQAGVQFIDQLVLTVTDQVSAIETLLLDGVDVLFFRPAATDNDRLTACLNKAQANGIHLISIDGMPGHALEMCSVTADNFGGQAALAEYVFTQLNGAGKIAYLQGDLRTEAGTLRNQGLLSVLERFPGINLAFTKAFDWSSSVLNFKQGVAMARAALKAHPDLDAIISATDEGALGVDVVLEERGLRGKILLAGFDGMPRGLIALNAGIMNVTARQPLDTMAAQAFSLALDLIKKPGGTVSHTVHPVDLVTRENIGEAALRVLRVFPEITEDLNLRGLQQKNNASFLDALLENIPAMLIVKEAKNLTYIRVNKAREKWLNTPLGMQLGKTADDFYPAETAAQYDADDRAVLASGRATDVIEEQTDLEPLGTRYTRTRKIPIFDATGKPDYLMIISEDITPLKRAEKSLAEHTDELEKTNDALTRSMEKLIQVEKMSALGRLVGGVAHELNTPIGNAILAISTLADHTSEIAARLNSGLPRSMLEGYLSDAKKIFEIIERNLQRSGELIQSFKQVAVDQASAQARIFQLSTLVAETMLALSPTLRKTTFQVETRIPPDLSMYSFPGPLVQVLMNLINNAVAHGFEGRTHGVITLSATIPKPGWVELVIQDDGIGIKPEYLKRIYDPFFTTKMGSGNSGLGLSIVRNTVTQVLRGGIEVSSAPGSGTRFSLLLPLQIGHSHV